MGLFDFLFGGSVEQQIQKHAKRIKSKDTPIEDRQASAHWLAENASPAAIRGLIGRFEMDYEHGMKDTSEKEEVSQLLIGLGQAAVDPLRACLLKTEKFARPLALYAQLTSQEDAMRLTVEMIEAEATRAELHPDKRRNLLVKLADFKDVSLVAVAPRPGRPRRGAPLRGHPRLGRQLRQEAGVRRRVEGVGAPGSPRGPERGEQQRRHPRGG